MKAMVLKRTVKITENPTPLEMISLPEPTPGEYEILIRVSACGVCHTELDEIEGRTPPPGLPIVLGHQVVGSVIMTGSQVVQYKIGDRVGVAWIYSACGKCKYCLTGYENLCQDFQATGRDVNGGYAQYMTVKAGFAHPIPEIFSDTEAAPLLCAGAIGYRSLKLTDIRDGDRLGLTGFGASAHLVLRLVKNIYPNSAIYVFSRSEGERKFALELGAVWAGDMANESPERLDCIIDTTPVWKPVLEALKNLRPGGRLVINAIRKEDLDKEYLLNLDYPAHLWMEKEIKSVANVTRSDVREFLDLAAKIPIIPEYQEFPLGEANQALYELKTRKIRGAKVLRVD
jgi:propanol-preferring alcohol dehydrogenase